MRFALLLCTGLALAAQTTAAARRHYDRALAPRAVPLLQEVLRFPTYAGQTQAHADQQAWLVRVGRELGLGVRPAGKVTEVELPGPKGAPVLGLVVHGDVQPVDGHWTLNPFAGEVKDGFVVGRGAADDKGPLVQALLAMKALKEKGPKRTHTVRLLVGSDEESANEDLATYLKDHAAPDLSLVLDANFPVTMGEKAWVGFWIDAPPATVRDQAAACVPLDLDAGLSPSIVPDRATLLLAFPPGGNAQALRDRLTRKPLPQGIALMFEAPGPEAGEARERLRIIVRGKAAHGGVNLEGGRNALVGLARLMEGELPAGGIDDLLALVRHAGKDLYGASLGLPKDPVFGPTTVNPATLKKNPDESWRLFINLRRTPAIGNAALQAKLNAWVGAYEQAHGAILKTGGWFQDEPLAFDPYAKIIRRLQKAYQRGTGQALPPGISGGGTYAKRLPRALAFGMWFPDSGPYPGHDVDEKLPVKDLHRGVHVLLEALGDLACSKPLKDPFKP